MQCAMLSTLLNIYIGLMHIYNSFQVTAQRISPRSAPFRDAHLRAKTVPLSWEQ